MKAGCFSVAVMDYFEQADVSIPGGNAFNQAAHLAEYGWQSAFIGAVGKDPAGDTIERGLLASGVDTTLLHRRPGHTASNRIRNDETGERFGVDGSWKSGVYGSFRLSEDDWKFLDGCDLVVTHSDCPDYQAMLGRAGQEWFVAVDFLHSEDYGRMVESADVVDILFSGGHPGMTDDLRALAKSSGALIVLTLGRLGSMAFQGGEVFAQEALPVETVVDTTGCGDAFQAAFTDKYFRTGDVADSLLAGARAGALATSHYGSIAWRD